MTATAKPPTGTEVAVATEVPTVVERYDPFTLMDHLDEEAIRKELEGIATHDLVYVVKDRGKEVAGLSKGGVDECCNILAHRGEVMREETLDYEIRGEGDQQEALFKVTASRYAVSKDGVEVRLDTKFGTKRQPLYYEAVAMTLDSIMPFGKYKKTQTTWRVVLESDPDYLDWAASNAHDEQVREFARSLLDGVVVEMSGGRKLNPFWYEAGAMKAARNASSRLIGANVKAEVIARAKQTGDGLRQIETTPPAPTKPAEPTQRQRDRVAQLLGHDLVTTKVREEMNKWLDERQWTAGAVGAAIGKMKDHIEKKGGTVPPSDADPTTNGSASTGTPDPTTPATTTTEGKEEPSPSSVAEGGAAAAEQSGSTKTDSKTQTESDDPAERADLVVMCEDLLEKVDKKTEKVWRGYFEGLRDHDGAIEDLRRVRRALQESIDNPPKRGKK